MMPANFDDLIALRPDGGFDFIMADPPWLFKTRSQKGVTEKSAGGRYDLMSMEDIWDMPIREIAADNCVLWLWATGPMIPDQIECARRWGFEYKTMGSWTKRTNSCLKCGRRIHGECVGRMRWGTGYCLRSTGEFYIIATRGKPTIQGASIPSHFDALAREHSRKPERGYHHAVKMMPGARRLDLFSRETRPGWINYGNESQKFDKEIA